MLMALGAAIGGSSGSQDVAGRGRRWRGHGWAVVRVMNMMQVAGQGRRACAWLCVVPGVRVCGGLWMERGTRAKFPLTLRLG